MIRERFAPEKPPIQTDEKRYAASHLRNMEAEDRPVFQCVHPRAASFRGVRESNVASWMLPVTTWETDRER